ncbi:MAG: hypothetical protein AAF565_13575 [Pseudomonadota bacterium]
MLRAILTTTGAAAGLSYYALFDLEVLGAAPVHLERFVIFAAAALFPAFGLLAGPVEPRRAGLAAAALALILAGLATLFGARFPEDERVLAPGEDGLLFGPFAAVLILSLPVLIAGLLAPGGWRQHGRVLPEAWMAAVKTLLALLFVGLFWMVFAVSEALLSLVGIDILEDLRDWDPGPYLLSGLVTGAALATAAEMSRPLEAALGLVLRLLRLLLLPVTAVMTLFVAAILVQGLSAVFEQNSAAGTMMAMAAGAVILVVAALALTEEAPAGALTVWSVRVLGVVLPVIALIALYAIWLRVAQYGWSPTRVLAALSSGIVVLFTLPVTGAALPGRPGWPARTLQGMVYALLATLAIGVAWFTPALDAQRIAAQSQFQRLISGVADPLDYDFWPLARQWGVAGRRALASFEETDPPEAVAALIATARTQENRWQVSAAARERANAELWDTLRSQVERLPATEDLPSAATFEPGAIDRLAGYDANGACAATPTRCLAVAADILTDRPGLEWLLIRQETPTSFVWSGVLSRNSDGLWSFRATAPPGSIREPFDVIAAVRDGAHRFEAPAVREFVAGPIRLSP